MAENLIIIDGHNLVYRAFYALPPMITSTGIPVNAVYGFTRMLLRVLDEEKPDYLAVALDKSRPTQRLAEYKEYKAQREPTPEDLSAQFPLIEEVVLAMGFPIIWTEGHEADDAIATLARRAEKEGINTRVLSGDRDLFQLVSPLIRILYPQKGVSDYQDYGPEEVESALGLKPSQFRDYKALVGDSSDNFPGVPGIGATTARELLQKYGTLDYILEHLDQVEGRGAKFLHAHAELALLCQRLATLQEDLPLEVNLEDCRVGAGDQEKLAAVFTRFEFKSLLDRFGFKNDAVHTAPGGSPRLVRTTEELAEVLRACSGSGAAGMNWVFEVPGSIRTGLVGVALAPREGEMFFVPVSGRRSGELFEGADGMLSTIELLKGLAQLLEDRLVEKRGPGLKEIRLFLMDHGAGLAGDSFDVELAAFLLHPGSEQYRLPSISNRYLGYPVEDRADLLGKGAKAIGPREVPIDRLALWAGRRAQAAFTLAPRLTKAIEEEGMTWLYRQVEAPLVEVLAAMEHCGLAVDQGCLAEMSKEVSGLLDNLTGEIHTMAGREFNLNSPKQLGEVLFEILKLPGGKKTKTGYSTGAEVLESLAAEHPIAERLLTYRELSKLKSTYIDALPRLVNPATGRIHTTFNQMVTATGRLSSSDPNLQNIPVRTEWGRRIRRAFIPSGGSDVFLAADYSQIELRVMAHLSGDPHLIEAFHQGEDIHARTASDLFGVPPEEVTREMRRRAKEVNFGILYGMSEHGLAQRLGISRSEARTYIDGYLNRYPAVKEFLDRTVAEARKRGFVTTLLGRRRPLPDLNSRNFAVRSAAERMAVNTPVQGTAADLIKMAMVRLYKQLQNRSGLARLVLQVHDELLFETAPGNISELSILAAEEMEQVKSLKVPLKVDLKAGNNWLEMEPVQGRA